MLDYICIPVAPLFSCPLSFSCSVSGRLSTSSVYRGICSLFHFPLFHCISRFLVFSSKQIHTSCPDVIVRNWCKQNVLILLLTGCCPSVKPGYWTFLASCFSLKFHLSSLFSFNPSLYLSHTQTPWLMFSIQPVIFLSACCAKPRGPVCESLHDMPCSPDQALLCLAWFLT